MGIHRCIYLSVECPLCGAHGESHYTPTVPGEECLGDEGIEVEVCDSWTSVHVERVMLLAETLSIELHRTGERLLMIEFEELARAVAESKASQN